jgi:hypothetical protein
VLGCVVAFGLKIVFSESVKLPVAPSKAPSPPTIVVIPEIDVVKSSKLGITVPVVAANNLSSPLPKNVSERVGNPSIPNSSASVAIIYTPVFSSVWI